MQQTRRADEQTRRADEQALLVNEQAYRAEEERQGCLAAERELLRLRAELEQMRRR